MAEAKPFDISKREVWDAFKRMKANHGAAGVDGQSIADFEADLTNNLYKLWNRMSSGSYFPSPVRRVEIPKADGGTRPLGIPTVADRIAQEVVRRNLEPCLELSTTSKADPRMGVISSRKPGRYSGRPAWRKPSSIRATSASRTYNGLRATLLRVSFGITSRARRAASLASSIRPR